MKFPLKFEHETETQKARIVDADGIIVAFLSADKSLWKTDKHPLKQLFDLVNIPYQLGELQDKRSEAL